MLHSSLDDLALKFGIKQRIYGSFVLKDVAKLVLLHLNQLGDYDRDVWYFVENKDLLKGKDFHRSQFSTANLCWSKLCSWQVSFSFCPDSNNAWPLTVH